MPYFPPVGAGGAAVTNYRGTWVAGTYQQGAQVTYANAAWTASSDTAGNQPGAPGALALGGGDAGAAGGNVAVIGAQLLSNPQPGTYTGIRRRTSSTASATVGFTATKPTTSVLGDIPWICFATFTGGTGAWTTNLLSSPLIVTAGQELWMVGLAEGGSYMMGTPRANAAPVGCSSVGDLWYGSSFQYSDGGAVLNIQATGVFDPWKKFLDLPVAVPGGGTEGQMLKMISGVPTWSV